ncbi:hypothetical protein [Flavobacterium sp.]
MLFLYDRIYRSPKRAPTIVFNPVKFLRLMEDEIKPPEGETKSSNKGNVPAADVDFGKVAKDVSEAWIARPLITLLWTNAVAFSTEAISYNTELASRKTIGGDRPQITNALNTLDDQMDEALAYVKGYILEKYKKAASTSYYAAFGIVHKTNKYILPADRNYRLSSLDLMLTGLVSHGFDAKEYGTAFWEPIRDQYEILLNQATSTDGTVSTKVSSKNTLKDSLRKKMNALINVLMGNYPDTYKAELRTWGFQKEKY